MSKNKQKTLSWYWVKIKIVTEKLSKGIEIQKIKKIQFKIQLSLSSLICFILYFTSLILYFICIWSLCLVYILTLFIFLNRFKIIDYKETAILKKGWIKVSIL